MSKLYFHYGTVNSAKTLNLLAIAHNYSSQGKRVFLIKPQMDSRSELVESRAGLHRKADLVVGAEDNLLDYNYGDNCSAILVDECQFLTVAHIDQLRHIATFRNIPVLCFGLRTKYDTTLWDSSARLFAVADELREDVTVCTECNHKAVFSKRVSGGCDDVELSWDSYVPVCPRHY